VNNTGEQSTPIAYLRHTVSRGYDDAGSDLVAHSQQGGHGRLGIGAILLLEDVHHILHQHKAWLEEVHYVVESCYLPVPVSTHRRRSQVLCGTQLGRLAIGLQAVCVAVHLICSERTE